MDAIIEKWGVLFTNPNPPLCFGLQSLNLKWNLSVGIQNLNLHLDKPIFWKLHFSWDILLLDTNPLGIQIPHPCFGDLFLNPTSGAWALYHAFKAPPPPPGMFWARAKRNQTALLAQAMYPPPHPHPQKTCTTTPPHLTSFGAFSLAHPLCTPKPRQNRNISAKVARAQLPVHPPESLYR